MKIILVALLLLNESLHAFCGIPRGEAILSGVTNPNVSLDNLYTYDTVTVDFVTYLPGSAITFNGPVLVHGAGISELNSSTFLLTKPGRYLATFVGYVLSVSQDGVEFQLNGVSQNVIVNIGSPLVLNQILNVTTVPSTLQVIATGTGVFLERGTSATLSIVLLNSP